MDQHQITILVVAIGIIVFAAAFGFFVARKRRSQQLRERFGPEYDRVVSKEGEVSRAEGVLAMRAKRREKFELRPLTASMRSDFSARWSTVQAQFVDDPKGAVAGADQLVNELMKARGYPVVDFDQRAADISVDHPVVVENYRAAHEIALRHSRGQAGTEDLRKAMVHYRSLFEELLGDSIPVAELPRRREARA
jgi:hypothetical protein